MGMILDELKEMGDKHETLADRLETEIPWAVANEFINQGRYFTPEYQRWARDEYRRWHAQVAFLMLLLCYQGERLSRYRDRCIDLQRELHRKNP